MIKIAPIAIRRAVSDRSESTITVKDAMHKTAIIKYAAASKRLNFLIKQGLNLRLIKPRKIIEPNSMHS